MRDGIFCHAFLFFEGIMSKNYYGIGLVLTAALIWGLGGVCGQFLFNSRGVTSWWLISVRMLIGGIIFLGYDVLVNKTDIFRILKDDIKETMAFSFLGLLNAQLFFYWTVELCNAATATVLQYTAPLMIMVWSIYKSKRLPETRELFGIVAALSGIFLIATHGSLDSLAISFKALITGMVSAIGYALYSILPVDLLKKYKTITVVGWGHILPGIFLCAITNPLDVPGRWDNIAIFAMTVLILGATVLTFAFYLSGLRIIGPVKASLLSCAEPLSSIVYVVTFLGTQLLPMDYLGMFCIIFTVFILSLPKK